MQLNGRRLLLLKDMAERHAQDGEERISDRERRIAELAALGLGDKEIAREMHLSTATVRTYWDRLRVKLHARNRTHAVAITLALGLINVDFSDLVQIFQNLTT